MDSLKKFYRIIRPTRKYMILITVLSVLSSLDMIIWPYLGRNLINEVVDVVSNKISMDEGLAKFAYITFILILIGIVMTIVNLASNYYQTKLTLFMEKILRIKLFEHLSTLSLEYFEREKVGKMINKISRGINRGSNLIQMLSNWLLAQIITYFITVVIFFFINVYLGILCVIVSIIYLYISRKMSRALGPLHKKINRMWDSFMNRKYEVLSNMHVVKSLSMEDREVVQFGRSVDRAVDKSLERAKKRMGYGVWRGLLSTALNISILVLSSYYAFKGKLTPGDILLVQAYIRYVQWPLGNFAWIYDEATESMKSINDVVGILDTKQKVRDVDGAQDIKIKGAEVEFRGVSFGYDKRNIIKKLSFKIRAGESVALVGPSGVGKSTIIKLLSRLYDTTKGKIFIDGQDISTVTQKSLRRSIGVVPQSTVLFNDSIANNIKYGRPRAGVKDIVNAAEMANISDFIKSLPKQYRTLVGERGIKLSGGEAQRVSIARAVLRNPKILVLDEATSSLDSYNEKLVQDALWNLIEGRTTFIIAHRLATVMRADRIFVIDNGRIVEEGNHQELIARKGLYEKLFKMQSGTLFAGEKDRNKS